MKRTLTAVFLTALLTLSLCACGQSGTETADVDLASLGQELTALCGEDLYELDSETITMLYGDTATAQALVWSSSGTTADEVAPGGGCRRRRSAALHCPAAHRRPDGELCRLHA